MYTQYVTVECYNALILLRYCEVKWFILSPSPPVDNISAMMIVQRIRGKIVRTLLHCITKSITVSVAVSKRELFFIKPGMKVNGQCCWDMRLSQQMLDAIKPVVDNNSLQRDILLMHSAQCNYCRSNSQLPFSRAMAP